MKLETLRTPDTAFDGLPNWPYAPQYIEDLEGFGDLRIHYIDAGPKDAENIFLCLHGQPTWGYLYRKMIPVFASTGARVIAPDWIGFGRSDKPVRDATYTYNFHRNMMLSFIKRLDLHSMTLVVQDWGGVLGLTLPQEMPERFERLLVMNTALAVGRSAGKGFDDWRAYSNANPDMNIAKLMQRSTPVLRPEEAAAYAAPFPDIRYKAGVRRFPQMVMTEPHMQGVDVSKAALKYLSTDWHGKSFMAIGMQDPVLGPDIMYALHSKIKNCPPPLEIPDGGHFVQEWGDEVATAALRQWGDL